jgi:hypothetical protein
MSTGNIIECTPNEHYCGKNNADNRFVQFSLCLSVIDNVHLMVQWQATLFLQQNMKIVEILYNVCARFFLVYTLIGSAGIIADF